MIRKSRNVFHMAQMEKSNSHACIFLQSGGAGSRHAGFGGAERRCRDGSDQRLLPFLPQGQFTDKGSVTLVDTLSSGLQHFLLNFCNICVFFLKNLSLTFILSYLSIYFIFFLIYEWITASAKAYSSPREMMGWIWENDFIHMKFISNEPCCCIRDGYQPLDLWRL